MGDQTISTLPADNVAAQAIDLFIIDRYMGSPGNYRTFHMTLAQLLGGLPSAIAAPSATFANGIGVGVAAPNYPLDIVGKGVFQGGASTGAALSLLADPVGTNGATIEATFFSDGYGPLKIKTNGSVAATFDTAGGLTTTGKVTSKGFVNTDGSTPIDPVSMGRAVNTILNQLPGTGDEFGLVIQSIVPVTGTTTAYEKAGILSWVTTTDPSAGVPSPGANVAGADLRGWIYTGNMSGMAWGAYAEARILSGADGLLFGAEVDSINNGSDQPFTATPTSKYALMLVAGGTVPSTAAIYLNRSGTATFHNGLWADPAVFSSPTDDSFITLNTLFRITPAGQVSIGHVFPSHALDVAGSAIVRGAPTAGAVLAFEPDATSGANGAAIEASYITGGYGPLSIKTNGVVAATFTTAGGFVATGDVSGSRFICRAGTGGSAGASGFNISWDGSAAKLWVDAAEVAFSEDAIPHALANLLIDAVGFTAGTSSDGTELTSTGLTRTLATGDLTVAAGTSGGIVRLNGAAVVAQGGITAPGYLTRTGTSGTYGANEFNISWDGAHAHLWIDGANVGQII